MIRVGPDKVKSRPWAEWWVCDQAAGLLGVREAASEGGFQRHVSKTAAFWAVFPSGAGEARDVVAVEPGPRSRAHGKPIAVIHRVPTFVDVGEGARSLAVPPPTGHSFLRVTRKVTLRLAWSVRQARCLPV